MNKFIVLEGLSGVGKTTVGKELESRTNSVYIKTPIEPFSKIREEIDSISSVEARALYYLASVVELSKKIDELLKEKNVIVDKYIYSIIAYQKMRGIDFEIPSWVNIRNPDFGFLITTDEQTRISGLIDRGSDLEINDHTGIERVKELNSIYSSFGLMEIENNSPLDDVIRRIVEITGIKEVDKENKSELKILR